MLLLYNYLRERTTQSKIFGLEIPVSDLQKALSIVLSISLKQILSNIKINHYYLKYIANVLKKCARTKNGIVGLTFSIQFSSFCKEY